MEPLTERETILCGVLAEKAVDLMYEDINRLNRNADRCADAAERYFAAALKCDQLQGAFSMFVAAVAMQRQVDPRQLLATYDGMLERQFPSSGPEPALSYLTIRARIADIVGQRGG